VVEAEQRTGLDRGPVEHPPRVVDPAEAQIGGVAEVGRDPAIYLVIVGLEQRRDERPQRTADLAKFARVA
jgi:hypothetical protein